MKHTTLLLTITLSALLLASCVAGKVKVSVTEYDENGNKIYYKDIDGDEQWYDYDEGGNLVPRGKCELVRRGALLQRAEPRRRA